MKTTCFGKLKQYVNYITSKTVCKVVFEKIFKEICEICSRM